MPVFWAGKPLENDEELDLRRVIALLRRMDDDEAAGILERFLPENDHRWTPNELETGAHVGPWMSFWAHVEPDDHRVPHRGENDPQSDHDV